MWALLAAHECVDERIVDVPVVVETISQEHISDDLPVPQVVKENLEVIKVSQERGQQWSAERVEDVPRSSNETAELVKLVLQERGQQQTAETVAVVGWPRVNECKIARPSKLRTFLSFGKRSSQWWGFGF